MLSENLIALRTLKGLSQEQVAEKVGISRQAYAKWEKGISVPDVEKCMAVADLYGTTVDSLMRENSTESGLKLPPAPKGKYIWGTVTINDRGQIVIPKEARDIFELKSGDRLVVMGSDGEGIVLLKADTFEEMLQGLINAAGKVGE
ncbi:MAG: helix-turn-helix domain-containing protein [Bacillota bacterium]|nr:helix-turn-helix domain-containing protein [Bacillota bacterium]